MNTVLVPGDFSPVVDSKLLALHKNPAASIIVMGYCNSSFQASKTSIMLSVLDIIVLKIFIKTGFRSFCYTFACKSSCDFFTGMEYIA
jgi:hypothetical protein